MNRKIMSLVLVLSIAFFHISIIVTMAQTQNASRSNKIDTRTKEVILSEGKSDTIYIVGDINIKLINENCMCSGCSEERCLFDLIYEKKGNTIFLERKSKGMDEIMATCPACRTLEIKGTLSNLKVGEYIFRYMNYFELEVNGKPVKENTVDHN